MFTGTTAPVLAPFSGYDITCNDRTKYSYAATEQLKELVHSTKIKARADAKLSFVMSGGIVV